MTPPSSCASLFVPRSVRRSRPGSRAVCNPAGFSAFSCGVTRVPPLLEYAVRCFLRMGAWCFLVGLIRFVGVFVRLRLRLASELASDAGQRRRPATPASDAGQRRRPATPASNDADATTRLETHGRFPEPFFYVPCNTHGKPRSFLRQNVAVRRFGALPAPLVAIHLRLGPTGRGIREGNGGPARRGRAVVRETTRGRTRARGERETSTTGPSHEAECEAERAGSAGELRAPPAGVYLAAGHTRRRRATSQAARDERASAAGIAAEARTRVAVVGGGVSTLLASAPIPGRGRRERCRATAGGST